MASIANLLAAKIKSADLSTQAAAEAVGVSQPSLRNVLSGKSLPNSRTLAKFAAFLGVAEADLKAQVAADKTSEKPAKGAKGKRGPGRKARASKGGSDLGAALDTIRAAAEAAADLMADDLALAVHKLEGAKRKTIAAIIKSL